MLRGIRCGLAVLCGVLVAGTSLAALAADTGTIKGKVTFKGGREAVPPESQRKPIKTEGADPNCTKRIGTNEAHVDKDADGAGLRYTLVSIKREDLGDRKFETPSEPVVLDQNGCEYQPHVLGIMTGQALTVRNSDNTSHNIHSLPKKNEEFNKSQPRQGMVDKYDFRHVETFKVKCDVHPWMGAYIAVFDHPFFAVTEKDGGFELKNVPNGEYTLQFWHETFGEQEQKVKVSGDTVEVHAEYTAGK
jgi:plastocyanin